MNPWKNGRRRALKHYDPPQPSRAQQRCPRCRLTTGVFMADGGDGGAVYHCANKKCSMLFEAPHPEPLIPLEVKS